MIARFNIQLARETEGRELDPVTVEGGVAALLKDAAKGLYYVAEAGGSVAGQLLITYEWSDWRNGNFWWLQSVYVDAAYRGQGIFKTLLRHVQDLAASRGDVCGLRLYMHAENARARQVYERLGWKPTEYQVFEMEF